MTRRRKPFTISPSPALCPPWPLGRQEGPSEHLGTYMNSAQDVLPEDRAEFERVLDEALRAARPGDGGADATVVRRVRQAALEARPQLTATAADEYHRYVRLREQLR